jgi:hypothetical protein
LTLLRSISHLWLFLRILIVLNGLFNDCELLALFCIANLVGKLIFRLAICGPQLRHHEAFDYGLSYHGFRISMGFLEIFDCRGTDLRWILYSLNLEVELLSSHHFANFPLSVMAFFKRFVLQWRNTGAFPAFKTRYKIERTISHIDGKGTTESKEEPFDFIKTLQFRANWYNASSRIRLPDSIPNYPWNSSRIRYLYIQQRIQRQTAAGPLNHSPDSAKYPRINDFKMLMIVLEIDEYSISEHLKCLHLMSPNSDQRFSNVPYKLRCFSIIHIIKSFFYATFSTFWSWRHKNTR